MLIGWVVFAPELDRREMRALEQLASIPIHAAVLVRSGERSAATMGSIAQLPKASADRAMSPNRQQSAFQTTIDGESSITLAKPLPTFSAGDRAVLLLAYPKAKALAAARKLQLALAVLTILGLAAGRLRHVASGAQDHPAAWRASMRRPGRLAQGEPVQVRVRGRDELARLAQSFNAMVGKIEERERRITQLAFTDVLTGLPNRTMFQQQLDHVLRSSEGDESRIALHCLDLDEFKSINDTLGHPAGDALLIAAGQRLEEAARGHFVARLGGDEFVVLQTLRSERDSVERLARALLAAIARPLDDRRQRDDPLDQPRHRHRAGRRAAIPGPCSRMPTSRFTAPRKPGAAPSPSSKRASTSAPRPGGSSRPTCAQRSNAASSSSTTSHCSTSRATASARSRRCFAGTTRAAAWSCPATSSRSPRTPG